MSPVTRRHALGIFGATAMSPLFSSVRPARAWVMVAAAIIGAVSTLLDMMKQGGSMEKLVEALDVKLDAVLNNQELMMSALAAVDQKITDIQKLVVQVPIETLGLSAQIDAADATKNVIRSRRDKSKSGYERYRQVVFDEASRVESSAQSSVTTPSLAVASWHALNGVIFIKTQEFGKKPIRKATDERKKALLRAKDDLQRAFNALISPTSVLSRRLADTRDRIAQVEQSIAQNLATKYILPPSYANVKPDAQQTDQPFPLNKLVLCAKRGEKDVNTESGEDEPIVDPPQRSRIMGRYHWTRKSISFRRIPINVAAQTVPGGRQIVLFEVTDGPDKWPKGTWSKEEYSGTGTLSGSAPDRNVGDVHVLDGCVDLNPLDKDGLPKSIPALSDLLNVRNSLVIIEGNLVNIQAMCQRALLRCNEIDGNKA